MTDVQFCVAVGIPTFAVLIGILMNSINQTGMNARLNSIDARFNSVDSRFNSLDVKFDTLIGKAVDLDNRVTRIEAKLGIN